MWIITHNHNEVQYNIKSTEENNVPCKQGNFLLPPVPAEWQLSAAVVVVP